MLLSPRLLDPRHVVLDLPAERPEQVFEAAGRLAAERGPRPEQVARRLACRHARGSPSIGAAVVVPHAAVPALARPMAVYLRCRAPLTWDAAVRAADVLVLLVPLPGLGADTAWLGEVVQGLRRGALARRLCRLSDPRAIHGLLTCMEE